MNLRLAYYCLVILVPLGACGGSQTSHNQNAAGNDLAEVNWQAPLTVATGNAYAGPWRMNDSQFHYVDDATVALRDDGALVAVWVDNQQQEVLLQRFNAGDQAAGSPAFEKPTNISRSPDIFSWLPRVVFTGDDQVYVLWQEIVFSGGSHGGEIFFARSTDGGNTFSEPLNLSNTIAGAGKGRLDKDNWDNGSLDIAVGANKEIFVAWTEYEGALRFRRSLDGGETFENPLHVSGSNQHPVRAPSLAQTPDGTLYLAWSVGENDAADIHIAQSLDGGQSFEPASVAFQSDGHSDVPGLAIDASGNVYLVYAESPAGRFTPTHIRFAKLDANGRATATPRRLSPSFDPSQGARAPAIDVGPDGHILIIWEHQPDADERARGLGFAVSTDAGRNFSEPDLIPGSGGPSGAVNGSLQGQLAIKLSLNAAGNIAVVNSQIDEGEQSRILLLRGRFTE